MKMLLFTVCSGLLARTTCLTRNKTLFLALFTILKYITKLKQFNCANFLVLVAYREIGFFHIHFPSFFFSTENIEVDIQSYFDIVYKEDSRGLNLLNASLDKKFSLAQRSYLFLFISCIMFSLFRDHQVVSALNLSQFVIHLRLFDI